MLPDGTASAPDANAVAWLPFVGAVIGALSGLAGELPARRSHPLGVALAFALSLALSGAIHFDGFADACDALFAPVPVARRLEIFKDPRHGTFALAGALAVGAIWLAALAGIAPAAYPPVLALAGAAARFGAIVHMRYTAHARSTTPSAAFTHRPPIAVLALDVMLVCALVASTGNGWPSGVLATATALVVAALAVAWARGRLDGAVVGDVFGFAIVLAEASALAAFSLSAAAGHP